MNTNAQRKKPKGKQKGEKCESTVARRLRFAEQYVLHGNATQAAEDVGVSSKSARTTGWRWLQNVEVKAHIEHLNQKHTEDAGVTYDWIINKLKNIASFDVRKTRRRGGSLVDICELDDVTAESINGVEFVEQEGGVTMDENGDSVESIAMLKKYKVINKLDALRILAQIKGMLVEKVDAKVTTNQPITVKITRNGKV